MDEQRIRITASERESLMRINTAYSILITEPPQIERRAKAVPRGKWYLSVARGLLERFMRDVYKTIPTEQLRTIKRSIEETTFTIGIKCPATMYNEKQRRENYGVIVPMHALDMIFEGCRDRCMMCDKDTEGQARCELRKAFDAIPNDIAAEDGEKGCPYYRVI